MWEPNSVDSTAFFECQLLELRRVAAKPRAPQRSTQARRERGGSEARRGASHGRIKRALKVT